MNKSRTLRRAFTLVELLTVVAVLAILGSLLIAVIGGVKAKAHQAACASNMRQIGMGLQLYANDHGEYPETTHSAALNQAWIYTLSEYLDDVDEVRICPAEPIALQEGRLAAHGTSYILNSFVFVQEVDPFGNLTSKAYNRPSLIPNPAKTILAFNASESLPVGPTSDHTHSKSWTSWGYVLSDVQTNRHGGRENDLASGSANYLYADTHVESIPAADIKQRTDAGENIAAIQ